MILVSCGAIPRSVALLTAGWECGVEWNDQGHLYAIRVVRLGWDRELQRAHGLNRREFKMVCNDAHASIML